MKRSILPRKWLFFALVGLGVVTVLLSGITTRATRAQGEDPKPYEPASLEQELKVWSDAGAKYQKPSLCMNCHARPAPEYFKKDDNGSPSVNFVLLTEYTIWKIHDKHAQAYAVLNGARGKAMAEVLGFASATDPKAGCISCHGMHGPSVLDGGKGLDQADGVSCGGCHGPSSKWLGEHVEKAWRTKKPGDKMALGMRDLRNPEVRARVCLSCHVGNAEEGKVVTHAMFAAGHPPLPPVEISTFSRNEPQHWRNAREVPFLKKLQEDGKTEELKNLGVIDLPYHRTRIALVGSIVALRDTMKLAHDRAEFEKSKTPADTWPELLMGLKDGQAAPDEAALRVAAKDRWPELAMAHSDCYACHHDLRYPGFRQDRGFGFHLPGADLIRVTPGRPLIRNWSLALLNPALHLTGSEKEQITALTGKLQTMADALNLRPFGLAKSVQPPAAQIVEWCNAVLKDLRKVTITKDKALKIMEAICNLEDAKSPGGSTYMPDYEAARQIAAFLQVVYEDYAADSGKKEDEGAGAKIDALAKSVVVQPYIERAARMKKVLNIVTKDTDAVDRFLAYVNKPGDINQLNTEGNTNPDHKRLRDLIDAVRNVANSTINEKINKDLASDLQALSDTEQKNLLQHIADYDPRIFLQQLKAISKDLK